MENLSPFSCHDTETLKTTMPQISLNADADLFILDAKLFLQLQQCLPPYLCIHNTKRMHPRRQHQNQR